MKEDIDTEAGIPLLQEIEPPVNFSTKNGASLASAVFNISTTMIGAGIMSIPATFKVLGVFPAIFVLVIVAIMGDVTGEFMLRYTHSGKSTTYAGLMGESFGRLGSLALQICVMITSFGCLIIYLIIIDSLRYTSLLAILLAVVFIVISSIMAVEAMMEGKTRHMRLMPDFSGEGNLLSLFTTIPIFMTAFGYQINGKKL
ncbi:Amino acid transporter AVT6C [Bienertia sinuspersici]